MAGIIQPRNTVADLGGKHFQDHKLLYDTPNVVRYTDQRPRSSTDETVDGIISQAGGCSGEQSASGEIANEDDDEDSNGGQADDQDNEEDEPAIPAPSHGAGKGKGKRPGIRIEPANDDNSEYDGEPSPLETGHNTLNLLTGPLPNGTKKRTFSNVSTTSLLFGEDSPDKHTFPRPKIPRTLSHSDGTGLLVYQPSGTLERSCFDDAMDSFDENHKSLDDDDEDYSGLVHISDDESDIEKVEEQEESYIINEAKQQEPDDLFFRDIRDARRLSLDSRGSADYFDLTPGAAFGTPSVNFNDFFQPNAPASPLPVVNRKFSESSTKRVRFDDEVQMSDSSSSSSSELDETLFPDIFLEQDKIPPSLTQLMNMEQEFLSDDGDFQDFQSAASDDSCWDLGYGYTGTSGNALFDPQELEDESSEAGSSGYETDMGDTTDEDEHDMVLNGAPHTPRPKSVLHRPSSAPASRAATPRPFQRSGPAKGPTLGLFIHEESHTAIAVTNRKTRTLTFYRPRVTANYAQSNYTAASSCASTADNSPRTSIAQLNASEGDFDTGVFNNTWMNTDIMLTNGIWGSAPNGAFVLGGDAIGPPEAFYPFLNFEGNGFLLDDEDEYMEDDESEDDVNLAEFMHLDDGDATDEEQGEETDVPATPATSMAAINGSTPARPTPMAETPLTRKHNTTDAMLEHFDRAGVTAFRNNQSRFRDIACLPHDPTLRASVSRPIRSGRSAETLMSPLRKRSSMSKKKEGLAFSRAGKSSSRLRSSVTNGRRNRPLDTYT